jgi:glycosyltransferase involved in cell wall biosynthesis
MNDLKPAGDPVSWPIDPSEVTIGIEGFNAADLESAELFTRTLRSLRAQTYPIERCEILVVVDPTTAGDLQRIRDSLPEATLLLAPEITYYESKNLIASQAKGRYVVLLDSDIEYSPNAVESLLASFEHGAELVVGNTTFDPGPLRDYLSASDWPALRAESGWGEWLYANHLAARRETLLRFPFSTDVTRCGEAAINVTRMRLQQAGIRVWFCREARGHHHLPPFWYKQFRYGAHAVRVRTLYPEIPGGRVVRIPLVGPFLAIAGTWVRTIQRAWRQRRDLPGGTLGYPVAVLVLTVAKAGEMIGAYAQAWAPRWVDARFGWFSLPDRRAPLEPRVLRPLDAS